MSRVLNFLTQRRDTQRDIEPSSSASSTYSEFYTPVNSSAKRASANSASAKRASSNSASVKRASPAKLRTTVRRPLSPSRLNNENVNDFLKARLTTKDLASRCPDTAVCMAIGTVDSERIKAHFDGFVNFKSAVGIKQIGSESVNGDINLITYKKNKFIKTNKTTRKTVHTNYSLEDYEAYAILKSSKKATSDNLMYEFIVGQYINKQNKLYPCFTETYGYYIYIEPHDSDSDSDSESDSDSDSDSDLQILKKKFELQNIIDYAKACKQSQHLALLIQYFKDPLPLFDFIFRNDNVDLVELIYILFQLYYPLASLSKNFTHYDLHTNNVLLYEPEKSKYIEYHYHYKNENGIDEVISFKSKYMVKIIDYGRCYFNEGASEAGGGAGGVGGVPLNTEMIYNALCVEPECNECKKGKHCNKCGNGAGFFNFKEFTSRNNTSDLWILGDIFKHIESIEWIEKKENYEITDEVFEIFEEVLKMFEKVGYNHENSAPKQMNNPGNGFPEAINNVNDAFLDLLYLIKFNKSAKGDTAKQWLNSTQLQVKIQSQDNQEEKQEQSIKPAKTKKNIFKTLREKIRKTMKRNKSVKPDAANKSVKPDAAAVKSAVKSALKSAVKKEKSYFEEQNELTYKDKTKIGDLYIYNDGRPMVYKSASESDI